MTTAMSTTREEDTHTRSDRVANPPPTPPPAPPPTAAQLRLGDREIELPIVVGTEDERAIDVSSLRGSTGYITLDEGYRNTGSCASDITYIDGEAGTLRYRGYPIEQVARKIGFVETSLLLIDGEVPKPARLDRFRTMLGEEALLHEGVRDTFLAFPAGGHPMAILSAMINAVSCYHPEVLEVPDAGEPFDRVAAMLISKVRTIAAACYKTSIGEPIIYPDPSLPYVANFLHMMFSQPYQRAELDDDVIEALEMILILHADHEQNCSTSTVRMVGSSGANLFASCAAGVCALWGPLHGGANVAVIDQLTRIHESDLTVETFLDRVKKKETKLFGFGHGVYKNYDPRAKILKQSADKVLQKLGVNDPLLGIARRLEEQALNDDYFKSRQLYPNVDFYSGILMRAMGVPVNMFTVLFAIGRMPGWIANWKEVRDRDSRIYRPRQVYTGPGEREL